MAKRFIIFCNLKITHFKDKLTSFIRLVFGVIYSDECNLFAFRWAGSGNPHISYHFTQKGDYTRAATG